MDIPHHGGHPYNFTKLNHKLLIVVWTCPFKKIYTFRDGPELQFGF